MTLQVENLTLVAGTRTLVADLSFAIAPGECWALLGRNGAGKSWLIEAMAGLRAPAHGSVSLDGRPVRDWPRRALAARLAVLLQDEATAGTAATAYWGTVGEYVALGRYPHSGVQTSDSDDQAVLSGVLAALELDDLADRAYRVLSGGERQRARLGQVLAQTPKWLLADEPLNHLDLRHQASALAALTTGDLERGALISLHHPAAARRHCSHALLLYDSGRVEHGRIAQVLTDRALRDLYGIESIDTLPHPF